MVVIVVVFCGFFLFKEAFKFAFKEREITKLTAPMTVKLEEIYGIQLPETVEFKKGEYHPALHDSTMYLWFDVAEKDFEIMFMEGFWKDDQSIYYNDSDAGFSVSGTKYSASLRYTYIKYSYPENGRISVFLSGTKGIKDS